MIIDVKEHINDEVQKHLKSTCDVCGKETEDVAVCCSSFGPFSIAVCKECLAQGKECYSDMVTYIAGAGHFPKDINEVYQKEVRRQLALHGISEEQFIADVEKEIDEYREYYG